MESLFSQLKVEDYLRPKETSKITNERQMVIKQFVDALNLTAGTKYKKGEKWMTVREVKPSFVAYKLSHLTLPDLYYFLSNCKDARCGFSKAFYGGLKIKKLSPV